MVRIVAAKEVRIAMPAHLAFVDGRLSRFEMDLPGAVEILF